MDYKKIKQDLESGASRAPFIHGDDSPFPGYGKNRVSDGGVPFPEYEDQVYCKDEKKVVDTYGGNRKVMHNVTQLDCPSCGAAMKYDADTGALACPYCGTLQKIEASAAIERNLKLGADPSTQWREETRVFKCGNCGATAVFAKTEIASACPFCGSPGVVDVSEIEGVRPNAVIPFAIGAEEARLSYRKWIRRKVYAPRVFKQKRSNKIEGVYMPIWTFDSDTDSVYTATVGDYYTVMVGSGKNRHAVTRVRYRTVGGKFSRVFDDVLVRAGSQLNDKQFRTIGAYPTGSAVAYNPAFLTGFSAEHYTKTLADGWTEAQAQMKRMIHEGIQRVLAPTCDVVQSIDFRTNFSANKFKYVLLPVYVLHKEFKGKNYKGFVNGHSGRAVGQYPKSKLKIASTVFGVLAAAAAIAVLALWLCGVIL